MDYLQWRGDLNFSKDSFNDVDALILSLLSYLPFKDIVPGIESKEEVTLKETAALYFSNVSKSETKPSNINPTVSSSFDSELVELLKVAASCPRFSDLRLSRYDENTDFVIGRQFAAVTFTLHNLERSKVVAFRGTDNSLVGWKEDFELTCMEQIPAQESACNYLDRTIGLFTSQFIVCGHSKGGNLAMYAGSHLNTARQSRLTKIINFDGPGFDFSIVNKESFSHCEQKIFNYIPEESMVGMLLEPVGKRTVVASSGRFMSQHNALNWGVVRSKFLCGKLSSNARLLEQTLKTWLTDISVEEREMFLDALFDILGASEGAALRFDPQENIKEIKKILIKYTKLDKKTKALLSQVFDSLTTETRKILAAKIIEKLPRNPLGRKNISTQS